MRRRGGADMSDSEKLEKACERLDSGEEWVDLGGLGLGDAVGTDLANALKDNTIVKTLYLPKTKFTDKTGVQLANVLRTNTTLETLDLRSNEGLTEITSAAMLQAILDNPKSRLTQLGLIGTGVPEEMRGFKMKELLTALFDSRRDETDEAYKPVPADIQQRIDAVLVQNTPAPAGGSAGAENNDGVDVEDGKRKAAAAAEGGGGKRPKEA